MFKFLIHITEGEEFAYGVFEYGKDCQRMVDMLLKEWYTSKTFKRFEILTDNAWISGQKICGKNLKALFPLCFDTNVVKITYNIQDLTPEKFEEMSHIYKVYEYDLDKFRPKSKISKISKNKKVIIDDEEELLNLENQLLKISINQKNQKIKRKIIIDDCEE
jgi:hypothetical protein